MNEPLAQKKVAANVSKGPTGPKTFARVIGIIIGGWVLMVVGVFWMWGRSI